MVNKLYYLKNINDKLMINHKVILMKLYIHSLAYIIK